MEKQEIKRGEIYFADLSPVVGSEQGGVRPVLIVQNNVGNKYSPTVIVAAITSQINKAKIPTHVEVSAAEYNLPKDSVVLLEQIRTIDKRRLKEKLSVLNDIPGRNRSEANIHRHVNNSNIIHYNENYLDLNGVITRKKSNTVFLKPSLQNNI